MVETTTTTLRANALISPTWHRLDMNEAEVDVVDSIADGIEIHVPEGAQEAEFGAFATAALAAWATRPEQAKTQNNTQPDDEILNGGEVNLDLAATSPVTRDMPQAFEHGMGRTAGEWLAAHAAKTRAVRVPAGTALAEPIVVHAHGKNAAASVASLDVVVEEGASAQVLVCFDAPEAGEGVIGSTLGVFADADAHVDIQTVHAASDGFTTMDDTALFLDDDARITVRHTVLGAGKSFVGLAGNLSGKRSDVHVTTRYVGHDEEAIDFNYLLRHRGEKTTCLMDAQGVLTDECTKILRGTIDLACGCAGAEGTETESVILADECVKNKSIPIILCSEDDVAGNHGATIGHMRPEQLNYLMSRGISQEAAERLFATATFEDAAITTPDAYTRQAIAKLAAEIGVPAQFDEAE